MQINYLHDWNVTYEEARNIQNELKNRLILCEENFPKKIQTIAGADISYSKNDNLFFAAVVVLEFPGLEVIEQSSFIERVTFPYIPGLLSFREGPSLLKAFEKLPLVPDVVIFDGQGIAHPRGLGLAAHLGLFLDIPTIGCAKKRLIGTYDEVGENPGEYSFLRYDKKIVGAVLRTKKKVKPIFVSQGHKIGLQTAINITLSSLSGYKLPEPVRKAHLTVNKIRLEYMS